MITFRARIAVLCVLISLVSLPALGQMAEPKPESGRDASFLPPPEATKDQAAGSVASKAVGTTGDVLPPAAPLVLPPVAPSSTPPVLIAPATALAAPPPMVAPISASPNSLSSSATGGVTVITAPTVSPSMSELPPVQPAAKLADFGEPVEASSLSDISPESIGLLAPSEGGLGATLWKGTSRALAERLLPALILPVASPVLNGLAERFLLTTASVPEGAATSTQSLIAMRVEKLVALGDVTNAWKLALLAKPEQIDDITLRLAAEAALNGSTGKDVCARLADIMKNRTSGEWQKLLLVCQLRAGDMKAAQVTLDLLHAQSLQDPVYFDLVEKNIFAGAKHLPRQLTPLKPLTLALLRQIDLPLPGEVFAHPDAALIPELLKAKASETLAQLALAERSAARGLITSAELEAVYGAIAFPAEAMTAVASTETGPRLRALLYQSAGRGQTPQKRVDLAIRFMQSADVELLNGTGGQVPLDMLGSMTPGADSDVYAATMARTEMLAGKPEAALTWLREARQASTSLPGLAKEIEAAWPLLVLTGLESDSTYAADLARWLDVTLKPHDPKSDTDSDARAERAKAANILLLLEAAGFAVPDDIWARVADAPDFEKRVTPPALLMERLRASVTLNRRGETVLLSLLLQGGGDPSLFTTLEVIRALRHAGLTADAAILAREKAAVLLTPPNPKP